MAQTLGQERAKFAFKCVKNDVVENNRSPKEFKSLVRGFSTMIINNGLGQALAFLKAKMKIDKETKKPKKNDHHFTLLEHINNWFNSSECKIHLVENDNSQTDLLTAIQEHSSERYRYYTQETLDFINWLRKFADAEIKDAD